MHKEDILEFTIPNWALPSLINGDDSGLSEEDVEKLDKFVNRIVEKYGNANFMLPDEDKIDLGFRRSNDIDNLGSDCSLLYLRPTKDEEGGDEDDRDEDDDKIEQLADEYDIPEEVVKEYLDYMGIEPSDADSLNYYGRFSRESDFAEQLVDEGVITDLGRYLYMTATDMRLLAGEEADNRVDDMDDEDVMREVDGDYSFEEIDAAREDLKSQYYDEIHDQLERDAVQYFVQNFGYDEQDLINNSAFSVDYDKLGEDLEYDYTYINHDGETFVFSNYSRGGVMAKGGGIPKSYTHFIVRKSDNKIINGYDYKGVDSDDIKYYTKKDFKDMGIDSKDFTLLTKTSLMNKGINPFDESNWTNNYAEGGIMAKGGATEHGLMEGDTIVEIKDNLILIQTPSRKYFVLDIEKGERKPTRVTDWIKMAMGGGTSFSGKVKSISKSLLKRKKVSPSVQKDYGKTYSKSEAIDSAKRIVGAMRKKEKMGKGGRLNSIEKKLLSQIENSHSKSMTDINISDQARESLRSLYNMGYLNREIVKGSQDTKYTLKKKS